MIEVEQKEHHYTDEELSYIINDIHNVCEAHTRMMAYLLDETAKLRTKVNELEGKR